MGHINNLIMYGLVAMTAEELRVFSGSDDYGKFAGSDSEIEVQLRPIDLEGQNNV
ncbi:hypothetical protein J6590_047190 [Homalodisca vitripennis]|nr:hypothetical protein J6590_047190 [Homalodisca vitripennis]